MRVSCVVGIVIVCVLPALGSDLDEPLDTSDWSVTDLSLAVGSWRNRLPFGSDCPSEVENSPMPMDVAPECVIGAVPDSPISSQRLDCTGSLSDASGRTWLWRNRTTRDEHGNPQFCNGRAMWDVEILTCSDGGCSAVATLPSRRTPGPNNSSGSCDLAEIKCLWVDNIVGRLYLRYWTFSFGGPGYPSGTAVDYLEGLPTLFEIFQRYRPTSGLIGFTVPHTPEGLPAADWFDTYYGDLSSVGDWSQAHPLQCGYPASAPSVGDYLTVEDTLPTPSPGQGYYYVTAATYQGQTRYGRRSSGGVLSGRNPTLLPACAK